MTAAPESPERLVRAPASAPPARAGDPIIQRAAELLRVLQTLPPRLPPSARARIAARLDERAAARGRPALRAHWPAAVAATLVLALGLFVGGAVGATWGFAPARRWLVQLLVAPAPSPEPARRTARRPEAASLAVGPAATLPAPVLAPAAEDVPGVGPNSPKPAAAPLPSLAHAGRAREAAAPSADPVVAESRLLATALQDLRQRRDPQAALDELDRYERRFPSGTLAPEASAARVDALLALGRRAQALQRLETLALEHMPRGTELRALRGELRAGRGELGGALDDFSAVLASASAPSGVVERALYGRGSCRSRLGDDAGARADLTEYLRRFPNGGFAEPARRALRD